jgi:geranylgeranyl reductase family protein
MVKYDVSIIGGGPIGASVAEKIASKGYDVSIFEKKAVVGIPVNCAGLVSSRVFNLCCISQEKIIQNRIKGANIHSPSGNLLTIGGDKVHALVINREIFDMELIKKAEEKGVKVFLKNKFINAKKIENHIEFKTSKNDKYKCKLLIGADGPNSIVRKTFSFPKPKEYLKGIGAEIENTKLNPDFVEIFIGNKLAPGFFAWIIPTNQEGSKARIGLCVKEKSQHSLDYYLNIFLKNKFTSTYFKKIKIIHRIGGIIPLGPLKNFYKSNVMLVGDAAAQVKPTSGGGIYPGLMCANYCSKVSLDAIEKNNFKKDYLRKYQKLCHKNVLNELEKGMKFRRIYQNLNDNQIDFYIKKFQDKKINDIISKYGDIDYPSKLAPELIKKSPSLLRLATNLIK